MRLQVVIINMLEKIYLFNVKFKFLTHSLHRFSTSFLSFTHNTLLLYTQSFSFLTTLAFTLRFQFNWIIIFIHSLSLLFAPLDFIKSLTWRWMSFDFSFIFCFYTSEIILKKLKARRWRCRTVYNVKEIWRKITQTMKLRHRCLKFFFG